MTKQTIAILGLGAMGSRMALRLLEAGYDVAVYNRDPSRVSPLVAKGARGAETARDAARGAQVVLSMVRDDAASAAVWLDADNGALAGMEEGAVAIESSTTTTQWVARLAQAAAAKGIACLDAPVVGTLPQADAGQLIHVVGGQVEALQQVRAVLEVVGGAIHHVGPCGHGMAVKLAINAMFAVQVVALAEVLGTLGTAGITVGRAVEILNAMPTTSPAIKGAGGLIAAGSFSPLFPIELVEKDLGYVLAANPAVPVVAAAHGVFAQAQQQGFGGDNIVGVAKLYPLRRAES